MGGLAVETLTFPTMAGLCLFSAFFVREHREVTAFEIRAV